MTHENPDTATLIRRLLETLDLMDFGIALMRQNIRRAFPAASEELVDRKLERWLLEEPRCSAAQLLDQTSGD